MSLGLTRVFLIPIAIILAGLPLNAQSIDLNRFEVASIRPSAPQVGRAVRTRIGGGPGSRDPGRFVTENFSLYYLISSAYDLKHYQFVAPHWTETALFDIAAKVPEGATKAQFRLMLQNLLAERFGLETHLETREITGYDLTVKAGGPKSRRTDTDAQGNGSRPPLTDGLRASGETQRTPTASPGPAVRLVGASYHLQANETMDQFATRLSNELKLPVTNMTGLNGAYDIGLTWSREETRGPQQGAVLDRGTGQRAAAPEGEAGPGLFTAIQEQLGLKLIPRKSSVSVLVVDKINKLPTNN